MILKPCPMCGSDDVIINFTGFINPNDLTNNVWYDISCQECGLKFFENDTTIFKAAERWNKRESATE